MSSANKLVDSRGFYERNLPTGFSSLDENGVRWTRGELTAIAARPSVGKTAFALSSALKIASKYPVNVLFFSLELSTEKIAKRMELMSGGDNKRLKKYMDARVSFVHTPALSFDECESRIHEFRSFNVNPVIFIDYLQLISDTIGYGSSYADALGYKAERLKEIAKDNEVPIVALTQMIHRWQPQYYAPSAKDIRDYDYIEPYLDSLIILDETENKDSNDRRVIIAKSSKGISKVFDFKMENALFSETKAKVR